MYLCPYLIICKEAVTMFFPTTVLQGRAEMAHANLQHFPLKRQLLNGGCNNCNPILQREQL